MAGSGRKTEGFFSNHVRLFTCLAVILVFLGGLILLEIYVHQDYLFLEEEQDTRPEMRMEELAEIGQNPSRVTGKMLAAWRGDNYDRRIDGVVVERYYYINGIGGRYNLSATESAKDAKIMYLTLFDMETKKTLDLLDEESDFDAFFEP